MKKNSAVTVSYLWLSSLLSAFLAFFVQVGIARLVDVADYGIFATALTAATMLSPIAAFGIPSLWVKIFGEHRDDARLYLKPSLVIVSIAVLSFFAFFLLYAVGSSFSYLSLVLIAIFGHVVCQVCVEIVGAVFQVSGKFVHLALWQVFPHLLRMILLGFVLSVCYIQSHNAPNAIVYAAIYSFVGVVILFMALKVIGDWFKGLGKIKSVSPFSYKYVVSGGGIFVLSAAFHMIYFQSGILFVKYNLGEFSAGLYAVAFNILVAVYLFPSVIYQKYLMPRIHFLGTKDHKSLRKLYIHGNLAMLGVGVVVALMAMLGADFFIGLVYGDKYSEAVEIVKVVALGIPFRFVSTSVGAVLTTKGNLIRKVQWMGFVAIITLVLYAALTPAFGMLGAAVCSITCEILLLVGYVLAMAKFKWDK